MAQSKSDELSLRGVFALRIIKICTAPNDFSTMGREEIRLGFHANSENSLRFSAAN